MRNAARTLILPILLITASSCDSEFKSDPSKTPVDAVATTPPAPAPPTQVEMPKPVPETVAVVKKPVKPAGRTTLSGVYTLEDAQAGKDMYAGLCANCHTAASHTGPAFRKKWTGQPLSELFGFMRTQMPKNDPASLADEDYALLLSYMLQMNQMPAGKTSLSTDPSELAKIRIDTIRTTK